MNRQDLLNLHKEMCDNARELMARKNADYAGLAGEHTVFGNLGLCESMGVCPTETGIIIRMGDKLSRLANLLTKPAQVKDESIEDTLQDLLNYSVLIAAKVQDRRDRLASVLPSTYKPTAEDRLPDETL